MGLENPVYLDELIEANPVGLSDFRSEGDDHIRAIKRALKNTFPGMAGRAWRKRSVSATGPIELDDNMSLLVAAGGITLNPVAAATLGNGFICMVRAASGSVTIDPGENINGAASMVVPNGHTAIIMCDGSEFLAMLVYHAQPEVVPPFEAGTKMVFHQTAAPSGWTKLTNAQYDNAALRSTIGVVGTGGADNFTTTFGTGKVTAGHVLSVAEMPAHNHGNAMRAQGSAEGGQIPPNTQFANSPTDTVGGNQAHTHGINNMNLKYVDIIVASKN